MQNPSNKVLAKAFDLYSNGGKSQKDVLQITWAPDGSGKADPNGETLNYSQFWLYCQSQTLPQEAFITATEGSDPWFRAIEKARAAGDSWGLIAVKCRAPEGRVRKAFSTASGLRSQGLRVGKGGRYLDNDPVLYAGSAVKTGTAIPTTAKRAEFRDFVTSGLEALPDDELRRRAALHGFKVSPKTKRAVLIGMVSDPAAAKAKIAERKAPKAKPVQTDFTDEVAGLIAFATS